jgi:hypothetical protein
MKPRLTLAALTLATTGTLTACIPNPPHPPNVANCTYYPLFGTWECQPLDGSGGGGGGGGGGGW